MNQLDRWVILANSLLAAGASAINLRVGLTLTEPWRSVRVIIGALAAIYAVAYVWLFVTQDVGPWSSLMRGVSLIAWPVVWIRPAVVNAKVSRLLVALLPTKGDEE